MFIGFVKFEVKQWFAAYQHQVCAWFSLAQLPTEGMLLIPGTGNGERGTGNGERGTGNGERGTGNGERGTGNRERGTGNGSLGTSVQR